MARRIIEYGAWVALNERHREVVHENERLRLEVAKLRARNAELEAQLENPVRGLLADLQCEQNDRTYRTGERE